MAVPGRWEPTGTTTSSPEGLRRWSLQAGAGPAGAGPAGGGGGRGGGGGGEVELAGWRGPGGADADGGRAATVRWGRGCSAAGPAPSGRSAPRASRRAGAASSGGAEREGGGG